MTTFDYFAVLVLAFFVYSFIGWTYESFVWAKAELKHFTNRGYLLGPCCPIYGFISLLDWFLLSGIKNPLLIFITGAVVCTIFEYITHYTLEKLFHKRWWDYSNYPLNLNGRISVPSSFFFGLAGLLLVKVVHPTTVGFCMSLTPGVRTLLFFMVLTFFAIDLVLTTVSLADRSDSVKSVYTTLHDYYEAPFIHLPDACQPIDKKISGAFSKLKRK